ncbi:MAG TPA: hypothetical protein VNR64_02930 [Vicinamibacterales bacterium]|nr:hypothetical protein [Vicinamibacterales bacterium]
MTRIAGVLGVLLFAYAAACSHPAGPTITTGLTGVVVRGPIAPVCQVQTACDAPFAATFSVEQGGRRVTDFRSDENGHFTVTLAQGTYRIVPGADAPVISPASQAKTVEVMPVGLTEVRLEFDTGIR